VARFAVQTFSEWRLHDGDHRVRRSVERVHHRADDDNKWEYRTATVAVTFFTGMTGRDIPFGSIMAAGVILTVPLLTYSDCALQ
jgi:hypothetical protein